MERAKLEALRKQCEPLISAAETEIAKLPAPLQAKVRAWIDAHRGIGRAEGAIAAMDAASDSPPPNAPRTAQADLAWRVSEESPRGFLDRASAAYDAAESEALADLAGAQADLAHASACVTICNAIDDWGVK